MKKILVLLLFLIIILPCANAKNYSLTFNGEKYNLLYSVKNPDFGGYLNEYFKRGETYNIWSEMVAVHHFPNAYSPIDRVKDFKEYLSSMQVPSSLTFDDKKNTAIIDFIMISDKKLPVVLEFNIFKYEKSKKSGSVALQYTKRYAATTTMQIEEIKKKFEKDRKKMLKIVNSYNVPAVVTEDIDKCISGLEVNKQITNVKANEGEINDIKDEQINDELKLVAPESENSNVDSENSESSKDDINEIIENQNDDSVNEEEAAVSNESDENSSEEDIKEEKTELQSDENVAKEDELNEVNVNNEVKIEETQEEVINEVENPEETSVKESETNIKQETNETELQENSNDEKENQLQENESKIKEDDFTDKDVSEEIKKQEEKENNESNENKADDKKSDDKENNVNAAESHYNGVRQILTNDKSEYIAKPRTKKEMKEYVKQKEAMKKAKERAKRASKKLAE